MSSGTATLLGVLPVSLLVAGAVLCGAIAMARLGTRPSLYRYIALLMTVAAFAAAMIALVSLRGHRDGVGAVQFGGGLLVDSFSVYCTVLICAVLALTLLGGEAYARRAPRRAGAFAALLQVASAAAILLVSQREMAAFTVAFATLVVALVLLTALTKTSSLTAEAAIRQVIVGGAATATALYGMVLIYAATGSTDLHQLALGYRPDGARPNTVLTAVGIVMLLLGMLAALGAPPFAHFVRHSVGAAPGVVAGFAAALGLVVGTAVLARYGVSAFGAGNPRWTVPATVVAAATMLGGAVSSLRAATVRRLIGALAVSQAGFLLLALVTVGTGIDGAALGGTTAALYLLAAAVVALVGGLLLAGIFDTAGLGPTREDHRGVGRRAPLMAAALAVALAALAGAPPFAGFAGRLLIIGSAVNNGVAWVALLGALALVLCVAAVLQWLAVFYAEDNDEPPFGVRTTPLLGRLTALAAVALGLLLAAFAGPIISLAGGGATALH